MIQVCLLSTRAGGAGLNLIGANHLVFAVHSLSVRELPSIFWLLSIRTDDPPTPLASSALRRCCSIRIGIPLMTSRQAFESGCRDQYVLFNMLLTCLCPTRHHAVLQAMARIWRDGQRKPCSIYRLLTTGAAATASSALMQPASDQQGA